jgi:hypothetical protein
MVPMILAMFLTAATGAEASQNNDARALVEAIESLQKPIQDFQCEYEGTIQYSTKAAGSQKGGENGPDDTFSGVFIWKSGGDTRSDSLHRRASVAQIERETLLVRMSQQQAERYTRTNDTPLGYAVIENPKEANSWGPGCLGWIFLIDKIKSQLADKNMELSVHDDQIEGRALKVLDVELKYATIPNILVFRYWIDLGRNGHVVRQEAYTAGKVMGSRLDITLTSFKVGKDEIWMPVSGETRGYVVPVPGKEPMITKEPTTINKIHVVDGTMKFNQRPGPAVFTTKHKTGPPISEPLRKLEAEFAQQKVGPRPSKEDAQKTINEQIAQARDLKAELVVASPSEGIAWTPWIAAGFGALIIISSAAVWNQQRRR